MNDTVGTMMTSSEDDKACEVAIIVGEQWTSPMPGAGTGGGMHQCSPPHSTQT